MKDKSFNVKIDIIARLMTEKIVDFNSDCQKWMIRRNILKMKSALIKSQHLRDYDGNKAQYR